MPSFYVAVCTRRELSPEWTLAYGTILGSCFMLGGFENVSWSFDTSFPLDKARNQCVKEMLQKKADYILFVDDDVLPPFEGVVKLFHDALPIVSGLYYHKTQPYTPLIARRKDRSKPWNLEDKTVKWDVDFARNYPKNQLVEVDAAGLGFALIMREVFEKVREPWFKSTETYGEDFYFYWKARQAGFKGYVDTSVKCLHIANTFIGEESMLREEFTKHWKRQKAFFSEDK